MGGIIKFSVNLHVYDRDILFVIGDNQEAINYINKHFSLPDYKNMEPVYENNIFEENGAFLYRGGYNPIVWLPSVPNTPKLYGTLSHEIFHAVDYVLRKWLEINLSNDSDEAYAHLISYVTEQFWIKLNRIQIKQK